MATKAKTKKAAEKPDETLNIEQVRQKCKQALELLEDAVAEANGRWPISLIHSDGPGMYGELEGSYYGDSYKAELQWHELGSCVGIVLDVRVGTSTDRPEASR